MKTVSVYMYMYSAFGLNIAQRKYKDSSTIQFIVPYSTLASEAS